MKLVCTQENLNNGLNIVNHLASRNANLPILNNVLISALNGVITLATTNLEIGVKTQIRGKIEEEGQYTVPAKLLSDYISLLPHDNISLELEDEALHISCKNSQTQIRGASADDYPLIPEVLEEDLIMINLESLKELLNQTLFTVSVDEGRPEISGVLFNFSASKLIVGATDSYRLAEKRVQLKCGAEKKVIIPLKTLQELNRILGSVTEKEVNINLNENQILFNCDGIKLISRLIEGNYPDYEQIIPTEHKTITTVESNNLIKAIKSAALFCKPGINDIKMTFLPDKNEIVIMSTNSGLGENVTTLAGEVEGEEVEIVFNYRYLLDGLNSLQSEKVVIKLNNQGAPGIFIPENEEDYLYVVMPIRQ